MDRRPPPTLANRGRPIGNDGGVRQRSWLDCYSSVVDFTLDCKDCLNDHVDCTVPLALILDSDLPIYDSRKVSVSVNF